MTARFAQRFDHSDTDIAQAAEVALKWNTKVPYGSVTVTVDNGWVLLNGTVRWRYQKDAASRSVRDLAGVKGVTNRILVKSQVNATDVRDTIEATVADQVAN